MGTEVQFKFIVARAIESGDPDTVRRTLAENPEQLSAYTPYAGGTWLHYAAAKSNVPVIQAMLEFGFDINVGDRWDGRNALTDACQAGRLKVAQFLLDKGTKIDVSTSVRNPFLPPSRAVPAKSRNC